jgi:hypothetical protein
MMFQFSTSFFLQIYVFSIFHMVSLILFTTSMDLPPFEKIASSKRPRAALGWGHHFGSSGRLW